MNTRTLKLLLLPIIAIVVLATVLAHVPDNVSAQTPAVGEVPGPTMFRVGEKLSYSVSVGPFRNSGVAELSVASRGKYRTRDAVELTSRFKTSEIASAAFFLVDESRTTFAAADSGQALMTRKTNNAGVVPVSATHNFEESANSEFDLLTLIYKLRTGAATGSFVVVEDEKSFNVSSTAMSSERVKTDVGEFDVSNVGLQSSYFGEKGLSDVVVGFSNDAARIPVQFRFKSGKTLVRVVLQSVQVAAPPVVPTPRPSPTATPAPTPVAKPSPTPLPENQPLSSALPFVLGEALEYRLSAGGKSVGTFVLRARERKFVEKRDTLFLTATATGAEPALGLFGVNDSIAAQVDAEGLSPYQFDVKINGSLAFLNQSVRFDQDRGFATTSAGATPVPLNTHSLLSLVYAIRSFNLKPSKDDKNPVNDTRVAVFYDSKFYIFTLRPFDADLLNIRGEKVSAQLVTIVTGNPQLDALNLKIWLSTDARRVPLRIAIGAYQADLVSESIVPPK